jgi:hypothetical protein
MSTTTLSINSLCGAVQGDPQDVMVHTTTCLTCKTKAAALQAAARPPARSKATRRTCARDARSTLSLYLEHLTDGPNDMQVQRLAWAISHLRRALWHETRGKYGDPHAYGLRTLQHEQVQ